MTGEARGSINSWCDVRIISARFSWWGGLAEAATVALGDGALGERPYHADTDSGFKSSVTFL